MLRKKVHLYYIWSCDETRARFIVYHCQCFVVVVVVILRAQITLGDILSIIQTPRERKLSPNLNLSK